VVTLDDLASRDAASDDPRAFLRRPVDTFAIDEAQLVRGLFRALKACAYMDGYFVHLATAFLIQLIPAWSTHLSAKAIRRSKMVIVDSGLAARLMGATSGTIDKPGGTFGPLLEPFVAMDLRKLITWSESAPAMSHFRDRDGLEVDIILERADGTIVGIEVKATSPKSEALRGLRFLAEKLGDRFAFGVLLCLAPEATPFGPKLAALPMDVLWL
jgi:uncharacterized protein